MSQNRPLLSISLLSSGRIGTIERCLSSLMPLKEQVPCEIVIVDTDTEHRADVKEILEKYADRIIPFAWCDDFSAARNAGLVEARGEWFLFVDDDEWFMEAQPVADFLLSPKSRKYGWANYRIRNFLGADAERHTDAWVSRLFRMGQGTKFVGRVHEYPYPLDGEAYNIDALAGHTGYIYADEAQKEAHARRNLRLLEKSIEEQPKEVRWQYQLLQEYDNIGDTEKQREICHYALKILKDKNGKRFDNMRSIFAADLLRIERRDDQWEACCDAYRRAMEDRRYSKVALAYMELDAAQAFFYVDEPEESRKHCVSYLSYYDRLHGQEVARADEFEYFLMETFEPHMRALAMALLIYIDMRNGDFRSFDAYFHELQWDKEASYRFDAYEGQFLSVAAENAFDPHFLTMAGAFWKSPLARDILLAFLRERMDDAADGGTGYMNLVRIMAESGLTEPVPWDYRLLWMAQDGGEAHFPKDIAGMPFPQWRRYAERLAEEHSRDDNEKILAWMGRLPEKEAEEKHALYLKMCLIKSLAQAQKNETLLREFAALGMDYYRGLYREQAFTEYEAFLPDDVAYAKGVPA